MSPGARALLSALALVSLGAAGAPPEHVVLVTAHCPDGEMERLAGLLGAELRHGGIVDVRWQRGRDGTGQEAEPIPGETRLGVTCTAPALEAARIVALAPGAEAPSERDVALTDVPESERPRMLSLALAELLRAGVPAAPASPRVPDATREWAIATGARVRRYFGPDTLLVGAEAIVAWRRLRLGAAAGLGSVITPPGRIDLRVVTGTVGLVLLQAEGSRLGAELGVRLELGMAQAQGQPSSDRPGALTRTASLLHVDPGLLGTARLRLAGPAWLQVGLEAGHAWSLVTTVDGRSVATTAGVWLGGSAAVRVAY